MSIYALCTNDEWTNDINQGAYDGNYTTPELWEAARSAADAADEHSILEVYGQYDQGGVLFTIDGWVDKDAGFYIEIRNTEAGGDGVRHDGKFDNATCDALIDFDFRSRDTRVKIHDLLITLTSGAGRPIKTESNSAEIWVYNNAIVNRFNGPAQTIDIGPSITSVAHIYNNFVVRDNPSADSVYILDVSDADVTSYVYANSFYAPGCRGFTCALGTHDFFNNINVCIAGGRAYNDGTNANVTCDYEFYSVTTHDPPNGTHNHEFADAGVTAGGNIFLDVTPGQEDLHLDPDAAHFSDILAGGWPDLDTNGNPNITDDIDGDARDASTPDPGADEFDAGGGPVGVDVAGSLPAMSGAVTRQKSFNRSIGGNL